MFDKGIETFLSTNLQLNYVFFCALFVTFYKIILFGSNFKQTKLQIGNFSLITKVDA